MIDKAPARTSFCKPGEGRHCQIAAAQSGLALEDRQLFRRLNDADRTGSALRDAAQLCPQEDKACASVVALCRIMSR